MSRWQFPEFPLGNIPPHRQNRVITNDSDPPRNSNSNANPSSSKFTANATSASVNRPTSRHSHHADTPDQEDHDFNDPRNVLHPSPERREKTAAENLLHSMVREFLVQEGHYLPVNELAMGAIPPSAANPLTVSAYMNRVSQGPSQERPLFSWEDPVSHPWNVAVVRVLTEKFRTYVLENGLAKLIQLLGPSASTNYSLLDLKKDLDKTGDVQKMITEKLESQQAKLRRARRRMNDMQGQTDAEVEDVLKREVSAARTRARRQERKRNLYLRRSTIVDEQLRRQDPELWEQINIIFAHFSEEEMSSDETEIEKGFGAPKLLRRIRKLWMNPELALLFHYIDGHYNPRTITGTLKKGSAPLKREIDSHQCNTTALPRPNLPFNFYSKDIGEDRIKTLDPKPVLSLPKISVEMDVDG